MHGDGCAQQRNLRVVRAVTVTDTTAPTLTLPVDQVVEATRAAGASVTFSPSALDGVAGSVPVICVPASGSFFPLGATRVTCTATDTSGNTGSASFLVTVLGI